MEESSQKHRSTSICDIQNNLKKNLKHEQRLSQSIRRHLIAGASSTVTSSSIANPLYNSIVCLAFVTGVWNRILLNKVRRYEEHLSTAQAKLNSNQKQLSGSLYDDKVAAEEHLICITEIENYQQLEQNIRKRLTTIHIKSARSRSFYRE